MAEENSPAESKRGAEGASEESCGAGDDAGSVVDSEAGNSAFIVGRGRELAVERELRAGAETVELPKAPRAEGWKSPAPAIDRPPNEVPDGIPPVKDACTPKRGLIPAIRPEGGTPRSP